MTTRNDFARERDIERELSLWNPLHLQQRYAIERIRAWFGALPAEPPLAIYDFGCGQKPYAHFAPGHRYLGIDIDEQNTAADVHADVAKVPVGDGVADVAVSFYMLEHVPEPQRVLAEKFRVLKPGGRLFMLVPLYLEEHETPHDYFRFTRFALERMMKEAGFTQIVIGEVNGNFSILGMHLARFFNRFPARPLVPLVNWACHRLELRDRRRAAAAGRQRPNIMTFAVEGRKL